MAEPLYITVIEAARRLEISLQRTYHLLWEGKLRGRKAGRQWRVSVASVRERKEAMNGSWNDKVS